MGTVCRNHWLLIAGIALLLPLSVLAAENNDDSLKAQSTIQSHSVTAAVSRQGEQAKCKESLHNKNMPVYRPPLRGAPAGRVAGGTRGTGEAVPYLCTLVPAHVGLTTSRQPVLYFFLDKPTPLPLEFTIIERRGISPLVETRMQSPLEAGIHSIRLADYPKQLKQGIQYKWFVALIPDEQHRSKDILAAGGIERVGCQDDLRNKVQQAGGVAEAASIYAEAGIWYDALASISKAISENPGDKSLIRQRAFLLEQVGLSEAAQYESRRPTHD